MGVQAEESGESAQWFWDISEQVFTSLFFLEMVLQLHTMGTEYFKISWRLLDFVIVWSSVVSAWVLPLTDVTFDALSVVKAFRLLRLVRILRVMKAIPELRMVLDGLTSS